MFEHTLFAHVLEAEGPRLWWIFGSLAMALVFLLLIAGSRGRSTRNGRARRAGQAILASTAIQTAPLLNQSEARVFDLIEQLLREGGTGHRLFAQVSVGEVLKVKGARPAGSDRQSAFNMINAKRFDFVIVDRRWHPIAAVEYHGAGHNRGNAQARDAIKRAACNSAGLPFLEISSAGLTTNDRTALKRLVGMSTQLAAE